MADQPPLYLTAAEAAIRLRATDQSVRDWAKAGCRIAGTVVRLGSVMSGRRYLFTAEQCDQFVRDCTAARDNAVAPEYAGDRLTRSRGQDDDYERDYAEAMAAIGRVGRRAK